MSFAVTMVVLVSALIAMICGVGIGYQWSFEEISDLEAEVESLEAEVKALSDELFTLHENPKEVRRRIETQAAVGCSFRGDYGRIVDLPLIDGEVA